MTKVPKNEKKDQNKYMLTAKDVSEICGVSTSKAYQTIRQLNTELEKKGFLTFTGKISKAYFYDRMYGMKGGDTD